MYSSPWRTRWCAATPGRSPPPARSSRSRSAPRRPGSPAGTSSSAPRCRTCSVGPTVCSVTAGSGVGAGRLVDEDLLLDRPEPVAAELLGPADAELAVPAHPADHRAVGLAVPVGLHLLGFFGEIRLEKYCRSSACSCRCSGSDRRTLRSHQVETMRRAAHQPGQILDRRVVPSHRIGDVDAHAAVQVMAGLHHRRRLRNQ